jgi:hypothetical protein
MLEERREGQTFVIEPQILSQTFKYLNGILILDAARRSTKFADDCS